MFLALISVGSAQSKRKLPCLTGACYPNTASFGHYETQWRRWPVESPRPGVGRGAVGPEVPSVEPPPAANEDYQRPRNEWERKRPQASPFGAPPSGEQGGGGIPSRLPPAEGEKTADEAESAAEEPPPRAPVRPGQPGGGQPIYQPPQGFPIQQSPAGGGGAPDLDNLFQGSALDVDKTWDSRNPWRNPVEESAVERANMLREAPAPPIASSVPELAIEDDLSASPTPSAPHEEAAAFPDLVLPPPADEFGASPHAGVLDGPPARTSEWQGFAEENPRGNLGHGDDRGLSGADTTVPTATGQNVHKAAFEFAPPERIDSGEGQAGGNQLRSRSSRDGNPLRRADSRGSIDPPVTQNTPRLGWRENDAARR
jgi:hypothetical protein